MTFADVKINETFYTRQGTPSKKIDSKTAISLVPELTGFNFTKAVENVKFSQFENSHVYGIGKATGYKL